MSGYDATTSTGVLPQSVPTRPSSRIAPATRPSSRIAHARVLLLLLPFVTSSRHSRLLMFLITVIEHCI